jgi:putative protease
MTPSAPEEKNLYLPELLAPAGSPEAFRAAVHAGADAIYLSGKRFGARKYAANFSDAEIEEAVRFAHIHGVRVYVTVNTLIHDRELTAVLEYLIWLYATGVDAVLVQDTGIAALARKMVPGLVLHASTQMTIHNTDGVLWAAEQGFSRVVLARELSLDEIQVIADETKDSGIGLEVFAHGALCYGYSGQCQLSSVIGGRSGNRGMCAQPCRKPWTMVTGTMDEYGRPAQVRDIPARDRFLLSPKDLCTYRHLRELVQSPVASLKIEGRMKSPEYVAIVVSTYRKALDAIAAGTWVPSDAAGRDLLLAFNRGFTAGYLFGERHGRLMGRDAPDNRGLPIGTVIRYDQKNSRAIIRPESPVMPEPGDGLLISHPGGSGETGFALNTGPVLTKGELQLRVPRPVPAGSTVFITNSRELDARARQLIAKTGPGLRRPLPLDIRGEVSPKGALVISGSVERPDGTVIPVSCRPEAPLAPAESRPLSKEMIARQLEKSGGTPFAVRSLALAYDGTRFAPLAEINRLRREFFAAATEQLVASYRPAMSEVRRVQHRWQEMAARAPDNGTPDASEPLRIGTCVDTIEGVLEAAAAGIDTVYFEPDLTSHPKTCGLEGSLLSPLPLMQEALAGCREHGAALVWKLPRITHYRQLRFLTGHLPALAEAGLSGCMVENHGAARAVRSACAGIPIMGFTGLNIFNHAAVMAAAPDFSRVTLSPELSRDEIALLHANLASRHVTVQCALVVQGTSEAMVTEDCLKKLYDPCTKQGPDSNTSRKFLGIRDDEGQIYPVRDGGECQNSIGNCRELCLLGYLPTFPTLGISEAVIDARHRPPAYVRAISRIYRNAVAGMSAGTATGTGPARNVSPKNGISRITLGGLTAGHFLRGLKE